MDDDISPKVYTFGDGTQTRDFIHVNDVVEAFVLSARKDFDCEIFNVGTGVAHTFNEVVGTINKLLGKNVNPIYNPNPIKNYILHTLADTRKAENELDFKSKMSLEEGIKNLIPLYKSF